MSHGPAETPWTLLLRGRDGGRYRIPAAVLETHRLSDEEAARLEATLDEAGGARGFGWGWPDLSKRPSPSGPIPIPYPIVG
jgi:hypothetical protein